MQCLRATRGEGFHLLHVAPIGLLWPLHVLVRLGSPRGNLPAIAGGAPVPQLPGIGGGMAVQDLARDVVSAMFVCAA